jgi:hypothetical protein
MLSYVRKSYKNNSKYIKKKMREILKVFKQDKRDT